MCVFYRSCIVSSYFCHDSVSTFTLFLVLCVVWFAEYSSDSIHLLTEMSVKMCKRGFPNPQWEAGGYGSGAPGGVEHVTNIL